MNRVLFKAAAIVNIAAAALIYVACSGDDGKDGPPGPAGAACTVEPSATVAGGVDVICGGARQTLNPGPAGAAGAPGQNGQGVPADGCYLAQTAAGFDAICGGVNVGPVVTGGAGGGCSVAGAGSYIDINCGTGGSLRFAKAICPVLVDGAIKPTAYDPANEICDGAAYVIKSNCGDTPFDRKNQFCYDNKTILARCNPEVDDDGELTANDGYYNPTTHFCLAPNATTFPYKRGFYSEEGTTAQITGANKLDGTITALCATNSVSASTNISAIDSFLVGGNAPASLDAVRALYNKGKFTAADFCQTSGTTQAILPKCYHGKDSTFTATQFCLTEENVNQNLGTVTRNPANANVAVANRCGANVSSSTALGNTGAGIYFSDKSFCFPTTGGATANIYIKCRTRTSSSATTDPNYGTGTELPVTPGPSSTPAAQSTGEYDVNNDYCELTLTTKNGTATTAEAQSEYTATIKKKKVESACGTTLFDPTTQFCDAGTVRKLCASGGSQSAGIYTGTDTFCDDRGIDAPNTSAAIYAGTEAGGNTYTCTLPGGSPAPSTASGSSTCGTCDNMDGATGLDAITCVSTGKKCSDPTDTYNGSAAAGSECESDGGTLTASIAAAWTPGTFNTISGSATGVVYAVGGQQYGYKAISGNGVNAGVWMTDNLKDWSTPTTVTFTWYAATNNEITGDKACPTGWSLPTIEQWNALERASGIAQPGIEIRNPSGSWALGKKPATGGGNGFNADKAGTTISPALGTTAAPISTVDAAWWASSEDPASAGGVTGTPNNAFYKYLIEDLSSINQASGNKLSSVLSVRCIRN